MGRCIFYIRILEWQIYAAGQANSPFVNLSMAHSKKQRKYFYHENLSIGEKLPEASSLTRSSTL